VSDSTSSNIAVDAAPAEVMEVIADLEAYPRWADGVREVGVLERDAEGRPTRARMSIASGPIKDSYVLAYIWDGTDAVRWDLVEQGSVVGAMQGAYLLAEAGSGTRVTYELALDLRIPMIGMLKRKAARTLIDVALKGLKRRVESGGAESS
jgi:ribosome-associated toxin RatA of RatAB toxin-antitoxin module